MKNPSCRYRRILSEIFVSIIMETKFLPTRPMKKFLRSAMFLMATLTLSGCSQEPAAETLQSKKAGDYSYLSRAFDESSGTNTETATSQAPSVTQEQPNQSMPQVIPSPSPQVAGNQTSPDSPDTIKVDPASTDAELEKN